MLTKSYAYELTIRPNGRNQADEYNHKSRTWIEGREKSEYTIELKNNTQYRVKAVVSVDGLAVTDGKPASYESKGFVISAYSTVTIPGWLVDNTTAAKFVFGKKNASYAEMSGNDVSNVGVIGAAFFEEKPIEISNVIHPIPTFYGMKSVNNAIQASCHRQTLASNAGLYSQVGTEFGPAVEYSTTEVEFKQLKSTPTDVLLVFYDSATNLQKMGIKLKERQKNIPDAFPAIDKSYCKPPPSWVKQK